MTMRGEEGKGVYGRQFVALLLHFKIHACAIAALGRTMKPNTVFSDVRAARRILVLHIVTSCIYLLPPGSWVGWRGLSLPVRVFSRATDGSHRSLLDEPGACNRRA